MLNVYASSNAYRKPKIRPSIEDIVFGQRRILATVQNSAQLVLKHHKRNSHKVRDQRKMLIEHSIEAAIMRRKLFLMHITLSWLVMASNCNAKGMLHIAAALVILNNHCSTIASIEPITGYSDRMYV
jgi:hypothetical protein